MADIPQSPQTPAPSTPTSTPVEHSTTKITTKTALIDKANQTIVIITSVAAFVVIFVLFSGKSLLTQMSYQNRLLAAKKQSLTQLQNDVSAEKQLSASYQKFVSPSQNIIGGSSSGTGPNDGDNGQIVLDALPDQYDFPALMTSMAALLNQQSIQLKSLGGNDNILTQSTSSTGTPSPVAMPFTFEVMGSNLSIQNVLMDVQDSIRPIQALSLEISGNQGQLDVKVDAQSYYQPAYKFTLTTRPVQ